MKKHLFLGAFYDYCCKVCWAFLALGFFKSRLAFAKSTTQKVIEILNKNTTP